MTGKVFELKYNIDQSDRSLYSMLVDVFVGSFLNQKLPDEIDAKIFASEPSGGILTQSWLVVTKVLRESNIETLRPNAENLNKSEEITESIAGHTLLWALENHEYSRRRKR